VSLGASYGEVVTIVSFLNSLSTAAIAFYFAADLNGSHPFLTAILYLFGGSWGILKCLRAIDERAEMAPHLQLFSQLCFSLGSSWSIPMLLFALMLALVSSRNGVEGSYPVLYVVAGLFVTFTPSLLGTIAFFFCVSNYRHCFKYLMPFALLIAAKVPGCSLRIYPVWREWQMRGIFFSQIYCFVETIGLPYICLISAIWQMNEPVYFHRFLASIIAFIVLCFVREGNDYLAGDVGLTSLVLPMFAVQFAKLVVAIRCSVRRSHGAGIVQSISFLLVGLVIVGGVASILRLSGTPVDGINENALEFWKMIGQYLEPNATIMNDPRYFNPVSMIAGRQIVMGRTDDLWRRGQNVTMQAFVYDEIVYTGNGAKVMFARGIDYLVELRKHMFVLNNRTQWQFFEVVQQNDDWLLLKLNPETLNVTV
jgi:hypothetical protein